MEKFLLIPVTDKGNVMVSATGVKLISQALATSVTIDYVDGTTTTITHDAMAAGDYSLRDRIKNSVLNVLKQRWTEPSLVVSIADLDQDSGDPAEITGIANA
jgi:hypothetical protein